MGLLLAVSEEPTKAKMLTTQRMFCKFFWAAGLIDNCNLIIGFFVFFKDKKSETSIYLPFEVRFATPRRTRVFLGEDNFLRNGASLLCNGVCLIIYRNMLMIYLYNEKGAKSPCYYFSFFLRNFSFLTYLSSGEESPKAEPMYCFTSST